MKSIKGSAVLALVIACGLSFQQALAAPPPGYGLVWSDEFDGTLLDTSKWTIRTGAGRDDIYTPSAVSVAGGVLTLTTYTENGTHYNGWIDTGGLYNGGQAKSLFKKGYFEARINFNTSDGMWSAFWLQSPGMHPYSGIQDPAVNGAEIDIMEHRNNSGNANDLHSAIHYGGYAEDAESDSKHTNNASGMGNGSWHTYGLLWDDTGYNFYYDGNLTWSTSFGLSNAFEYLILSSEAQDNSWAGDIPSGGYGSLATSTTNMQVDYVRVYALPEPGAISIAGGFLLLALGRRGKRI